MTEKIDLSELVECTKILPDLVKREQSIQEKINTLLIDTNEKDLADSQPTHT